MDFTINLQLMSLDNYKLLFTRRRRRLSVLVQKQFVDYSACIQWFGTVLSSLVGYGLGAYVFKGRNLIFVLVLFV